MKYYFVHLIMEREDSFRIGRLSGIAISDDPAFKGKVALFRNGVRILV